MTDAPKRFNAPPLPGDAGVQQIRDLLSQVQAEVATLRQEVAALRAEVATIRG